MKNSKKKLLFTLSIIISLLQNVIAQNLSTTESDYYQPPTSFANEIDLKADNYVTDNDFDTNDSQGLQNAIDFISRNGGGKITIPEGNYSFNEIRLKSNIHLEIDSRAILRPIANPNDRSIVMFLVTSDNATPIENTSIKGTNGKFTVDIEPIATTKIRIFNYRNVRNFLLENVIILDKKTKFASIVFNGVGIGDNVYGAIGGVVKNIEVKDADYGYGVMQMQIAKNIFFKNIVGEGGTVLRFEPHNKNLRTPTLNGLTNVIDGMVARNITSIHGNSAIMVSPHFVRNGKLDIRNVTSNSSGFAVRLGNGFTTTEERALGLTAGSFNQESIFRDIKVLYSSDSAQVRSSHIKFIPCELRFGKTFQPTKPGGTHNFWTPPAGGVLISSGLSYNFNESHVTMDPEYDPEYDFITNNEGANLDACNRRLNNLTETIAIANTSSPYSLANPIMEFNLEYEVKKPRDLVIQFMDQSSNIAHTYKEIAYTGRTQKIEIPITPSLLAGDYTVKMHLVPINENISNSITSDTADIIIAGSTNPTLSIIDTQPTINLSKNKTVISPNPTSDFVKLNPPLNWKLFSVTGAILDQGNKDTIDLSSYPKGLYFINTDTNRNFKILKN